MFQVKAKLLYNKRVKESYFHCALNIPKIAENALPGQFVNMKLNDSCDPLLRRPFSIHRVKGREVEILYQVVGKGTEILAQRKPGEYLDVIGPLGKGFTCPAPNTQHLTPILVAGGMGVAPLAFLAEELNKVKRQKAKVKTWVLLGARTKEDLLCIEEFKRLGCEVKMATDNGSAGFNGKVTDLLKHELSAISYQLSAIYACGPRPMLKEISQVSHKYNITSQISLEEHMACGIGACLGCVVRTKAGYQRVCKEGPVFHAREITW